MKSIDMTQDWKPEIKALQKVLNNYGRIKKNVSFIQIGSHDGTTGDPLNKHIIQRKWRGILVEPVSYIYEKLKDNYFPYKDQLVFENVAISNKDGEATFYRLKEVRNPNLPVWYDQLGSFYKSTILTHKKMIPQLEELLIEEKVATISFETLLKKYNIINVDLIHIDTEGYDAEVLKQIDFKGLMCEVVIFEHKHLTITDYKQCIRMLKRNEFKLFRWKKDTIGVNKKVFERLNYTAKLVS